MSGFKPSSPFQNNQTNATPAAPTQSAAAPQPIAPTPVQAPSVPVAPVWNSAPAPISAPQPTSIGALTPMQPIDTDADIQRELAAIQLPAHHTQAVRQMVGALDFVNQPN